MKIELELPIPLGFTLSGFTVSSLPTIPTDEEGRPHPMLQVIMTVGPDIVPFLISPDTAKQIAGMLVEAAQRAGTGIEVPRLVIPLR
jgi:hypothetical protein